MNFDLAQALGWMATFLFSIMLIPQMIKTLKTRDTSGVSLFLFVIYLIANCIALAYALLIHQSPLVIKYTLAIMTTLVYLVIFGVYFKKKKEKEE